LNNPAPTKLSTLPLHAALPIYSHGVGGIGFWAGREAVPEPVFYSYAYPTPDGFSDAPVQPAAATWHPTLREFILPYEEVRRASAPDEVLLQFAQSTYEAAARLAKWDREALEHRGPWPGGH